MNLATRGLGKRSGMVATWGMGRRVIFILEVAGQYIAAVSRVWSLEADSRAWADGALDRVWVAFDSSRAWSHVTGQRVWSAFNATRSWLVSKVRAWRGSSDRSWRDDVDR